MKACDDQQVTDRQLDHESLIKTIYPELRELAGRLLRKERDNHTLQRTALIHETFIRILGKRRVRDFTPQQFLAFAAHQMRQILIDYGRKHSAKKRGGELARVPFFESEHGLFRDEDGLLALNEALERLGELDARALCVVELKYFGGCTNAETAEVLGVSDGTVEAIWLHARLWLYRELSAPAKAPLPTAAQRKCSTSKMSELSMSP